MEQNKEVRPTTARQYAAADVDGISWNNMSPLHVAQVARGAAKLSTSVGK